MAIVCKATSLESDGCELAGNSTRREDGRYSHRREVILSKCQRTTDCTHVWSICDTIELQRNLILSIGNAPSRRRASHSRATVEACISCNRSRSSPSECAYASWQVYEARSKESNLNRCIGWRASDVKRAQESIEGRERRDTLGIDRCGCEALPVWRVAESVITHQVTNSIGKCRLWTNCMATADHCRRWTNKFTKAAASPAKVNEATTFQNDRKFPIVQSASR